MHTINAQRYKKHADYEKNNDICLKITKTNEKKFSLTYPATLLMQH